MQISYTENVASLQRVRKSIETALRRTQFVHTAEDMRWFWMTVAWNSWIFFRQFEILNLVTETHCKETTPGFKTAKQQ